MWIDYYSLDTNFDFVDTGTSRNSMFNEHRMPDMHYVYDIDYSDSISDNTKDSNSVDTNAMDSGDANDSSSEDAQYSIFDVNNMLEVGDVDVMNPVNENDLILILIGSPGSGKSATGNTILNEKRFKTAMLGRRVTEDIDFAVCHDRKLKVFDTPGIDELLEFSNLLDTLKTKYAIGNPIFGVTLRSCRVTNDETKLIHNLLVKYQEYRFCVIFTNTYELAPYGGKFHTKMFTDWLENKEINNVIKKHQLQYCLMENNIDIDRHEQSVVKLIELLGSIPMPIRSGDSLQTRLNKKLSLTSIDLLHMINTFRTNKNLSLEMICQILNDAGSDLSIDDLKKVSRPVKLEEKKESKHPCETKNMETDACCSWCPCACCSWWCPCACCRCTIL